MLNRVKFFLLCSILSMLFAVPAFAAPQLKVEPPEKEVTTGKSVVLVVRLEWPQAEGPYEINSLEPKLDNLTLVGQNQSQETGDIAFQTFLYEFRPVKTGMAVIYPFEISYRKNAAEPWVPMLVPEQTIIVVSNFPVKAALIGLSILIALSILIFLGLKQWELWKLRAALRSAPAPDPKQRIYAQAEEAITNFSSTDPKEKIAHWSHWFRIVVATYYSVSTAASFADILSFLKVKEIPAGDRNEISRIFEQLTEMKFSPHDPSEYDLARMERTLLQYVTGKIIIGGL